MTLHPQARVKHFGLKESWGLTWRKGYRERAFLGRHYVAHARALTCDLGHGSWVMETSP